MTGRVQQGIYSFTHDMRKIRIVLTTNGWGCSFHGAILGGLALQVDHNICASKSDGPRVNSANSQRTAVQHVRSNRSVGARKG